MELIFRSFNFQKFPENTGRIFDVRMYRIYGIYEIWQNEAVRDKSRTSIAWDAVRAYLALSLFMQLRNSYFY
jgi:hypothetical protein